MTVCRKHYSKRNKLYSPSLIEKKKNTIRIYRFYGRVSFITHASTDVRVTNLKFILKRACTRNISVHNLSLARKYRLDNNRSISIKSFGPSKNTFRIQNVFVFLIPFKY